MVAGPPAAVDLCSTELIYRQGFLREYGGCHVSGEGLWTPPFLPLRGERGGDGRPSLSTTTWTCWRRYWGGSTGGRWRWQGACAASGAPSAAGTACGRPSATVTPPAEAGPPGPWWPRSAGTAGSTGSASVRHWTGSPAPTGPTSPSRCRSPSHSSPSTATSGWAGGSSSSSSRRRCSSSSSPSTC
ncbi:unnamed protein product, partial [Musa banksii]